MADIILSYSRREDAPHSEKAMQKLLDAFKTGHFQISESRSQSMKNAKFIVFWTKNPDKLEKYIDQIPIGWYLTFTITGLGGTDHETFVPKMDECIDQFIRIASKYPGRVIWRFDPILGLDDDIERFEYIAKRLQGYTDTIIFSFVDTHYIKSGKYKPVTKWKQNQIIPKLIEISSKYNMTLRSCCENVHGIKPNKCIDDERISQILGRKVEYVKDPSQKRKGCQCHKSIDLGSYLNTCPHQCDYCYCEWFVERSKEQEQARLRAKKIAKINSI